MGPLTIVFLSLLTYLSIKGRLAEYVALATTPAPDTSIKGGSSDNTLSDNGSDTLGAVTRGFSQLSSTQNDLWSTLSHMVLPGIGAPTIPLMFGNIFDGKSYPMGAAPLEHVTPPKGFVFPFKPAE